MDKWGKEERRVRGRDELNGRRNSKVEEHVPGTLCLCVYVCVCTEGFVVVEGIGALRERKKVEC